MNLSYVVPQKLKLCTVVRLQVLTLVSLQPLLQQNDINERSKELLTTDTMIALPESRSL